MAIARSSSFRNASDIATPRIGRISSAQLPRSSMQNGWNGIDGVSWYRRSLYSARSTASHAIAAHATGNAA
jgi:hypothetical protein